MKRRITVCLLAVLLAVLPTLFGCTETPAIEETTVQEETKTGEPVLLTRDDWAPEVKTAVNDLLLQYGNTSENYDENSYAVFDFDNTTAIFDVCENAYIYQLEHMCLALTPDNIAEVLSTDLGDMDKDLTDLGFGKGSYNDWISDITASYTALYTEYGPFTPAGIQDEEIRQTILQDPQWSEFAVKVRTIYELIGENESHEVSYPWLTYLYTGFAPDEVYNLSYQSCTYYQDRETEMRTWTSPAEIESKTGVVTFTFESGTSVTDNNRELWKALSENGIKVWVCSASDVNIIRAAVDVFDLHDYITGVIGMTSEVGEDGIIVNRYDYETGHAYILDENSEWKVDDTTVVGAQTQGIGKVTAVNNVCVSRYGIGPIAGFGDSTGDFNFCTEYENLKLVVCYNRANRKVTDGGSLLAELAMYEKDTLQYTLNTAVAAGDTLYVLQGRDENGTRSLLPGNETRRLNETEEKLFANADNEAVLAYMRSENMSVADAAKLFCLQTDALTPGNPVGITYGFLNEYNGYHSR